MKTKLYGVKQDLLKINIKFVQYNSQRSELVSIRNKENISLSLGPMAHSQLKKFLTPSDLTSISPFYIDRKARSPIIRHPRCLHSHRINHQSMGNLSLTHANGRKSDRYLQNQQSFHSFQLSPQALSSKYTIQCQNIRTQIFKQTLREMLEQYYLKREKQYGKLTQNVKKERTLQMEKLQNSILRLYIDKRRIFNQIKKSCEPIDLKAQMSLFKNQIRSLIQHECKINEQISQILQKFLVTFLTSNEDKNSQKQHQNQQKALKNNEEDHNFILKTTMPDILYPFSDRSLGLSLFGMNTFSSFNVKKDEVLPEQIQSAKKFISKFKTFKTIKSGSQIFPIIVKQTQKQEIKEPQPINNFKQTNQNNTNLNSGQKFYNVIKQILIKSKQEKQGEVIQQKPETNPLNTAQHLVQSKRKHAKNTDRQRQISSEMSSPLKKLSKFNQKGHGKKVRITGGSSSQDHTRKIKKKLLQNGKSKSPLSKKQNQKSKSTTKQKREPKKIIEVSDKKQKEQISGQNKGQKLKPKARLQKIGLNYAKFIGKIMKANQGEKPNGVDKFKYFRKINTRQAFLKKKNKYALIDEELAGLHLQNLKLNQEKTQRIMNQSLLQSAIDSLDSDEVQKRGRMTKYEQARLMYNMRNIKSRQLISNTNTLNWSLKNDMHKRKRPSFCAVLDLQETDKKLKSPQGSFKYKNIQTSTFLQTEHCLGIGIFQQKSKKSKSSSNSTRYLNQNQELELAQLTNYQQFDLKTVKSNITSYLRKFMEYNDKAKELYNFLMFMQQSRKVTLEQQQINSSLDQLKIQKQEDEIKKVIGSVQVQIEQYEGCSNLYEYTNWNEKNFSIANKRFIDKLDDRSIELLYWNSEQTSKTKENLQQRSLKQITNIPI